MAQFVLPKQLIHDAAQKVDHFARDFLQSQGLNHFSFLRFFQDGSCISLSTQPNFIIDWLIKSPVITTLPKEAIYQQTYTYLWNEVLPQHLLKFAEDKYSLYQGITLIFRYLDHYDHVGFAMPEERAMPYSYYLSSLPLLRWFYGEFVKKNQRFICELEQKKIYLPKDRQDVNLCSIILQNQKGKIGLEGANGNTYVTQKELFCINLVKNGYSYKQIADIFAVSSRTIDTYLTRAKERTGYRNFDEIFQHII